MPYSTKLFIQEMEFFMNMGSRALTTHETNKLHGLRDIEGRVSDETEDLNMPLPTRVYAETRVPEIRETPVNLNIEGAMKALQEVQEDVKKVENFVIPIVEERKEEETAPRSVLKPATAEPAMPQEAMPQEARPQEAKEETNPPVQAKAEIVLPPGEPENAPLIVVDTSEPAMIAEGLVQPAKAAPGRPVGTTKRKIVIQEENNTPEEVMDPSHYKDPILVEKLE
jgi:hypothetical protein